MLRTDERHRDWAAWVATKMEQIIQEPDRAVDLAKTVLVEAQRLASTNASR